MSIEYDVQLSAVTNQLQAEGQDPDLARRAFDDAVTDILHRPEGGRLDAKTVYAAAAQYALAKHSDMGASASIDGLLQAAKNPEMRGGDVMASMGGLLATAAIASGAFTAGVGAAIVGGLAIMGKLLNDWLGGASGPQAVVCDTAITNPLPCLVGSCMLSDVCLEDAGKRVSDPTADGLWRLFPSPNRPEDGVWFQTPSGGPFGGFGMTFFNWRGARWANAAAVHGIRALEGMFGPDVWAVLNLEAGNVPPPLRGVPQDFWHAFAVAYKKNKEFTLNGLKSPMPDWQVLLQTALTWNRAHDPGRPASISSDAPSPFGPWVMQARAASSANTPGGALPVNTGPRKSFAKVVKPSVLKLSLGPKIVPIGKMKPIPKGKTKAILGAGAGALAVFFFAGLGPLVLVGAVAGGALGHVFDKPQASSKPAPKKR